MKKVLYCKYSTERSPRFAIRTEIYEEDLSEEEKTNAEKNTDNLRKRYVEKKAISPEGISHVEHIAATYETLADSYRKKGLFLNQCTKTPEGVLLEYLTGKTVQEKVEDALWAGDEQGAKALFEEYLEKCFFAFPTEPFVACPEFAEVFGEYSFPEGEMALPAADIDLICSNVLVNETGWHVMDYEWTFFFPVPVKYVLYRSAFLAHHQMKRCGFLQLDALMKKLDITPQQQEIYETMETHFQTYIRGEVRSAYEWQQALGKRVITINDTNEIFFSQRMEADGSLKGLVRRLGRKGRDVFKKDTI